MKTSIIIILLFCLISSCNHKKNKLTNQSLDTLITVKSENINCLKGTKGFVKKFGMVIPRYFELIDYISIDINDDGKQDTIAVLSPSSFIPINVREVCDTINVENRLLVNFTNINNIKSKATIFPDIISNDISAAWGGYETLKNIKKNVFALQGDTGQGCKFKYNIYMSIIKKNIYVDSLNFISYCPGNDLSYRTKTYNFKKKLEIKYFNRKKLDSLKSIYGFN
ncbi:hypothetical protein B0A58_09810 [Flavobacterium branchiophilum NBRC 15030 = ATCC 35035]|uniref:Lipoprotein n=1 Tax=Flavobacterium branchiophilum TaxID=55197 RepID=A0A543G5H0_9FLAO|nr:hypothetical protein [Flavobacterium branchiophilum]OXA74789.1 hypothetical protein B0A58_09810 [Flavobacterium branchiophilum NBRC 15030 = ATCC 35035]TQM41328.1 hypothetical protein BC670_2279 [Flavobacterium branchiophilum]GEM56336.1 hypothetical protein FB1_25570 [Flavobacterium branchiophilum NBRC 15030 = ATCC 35035]